MTTTPTTPHTVVVTGHGTADAAPDRAWLHVTASCLRPDAASAVAAADTCLRAVTDAATGTGTDAPTTTTMTVRAEQAHGQDGVLRRTGVRAVHGLRVPVRRVDTLGTVLAAVLAAGGDDLTLDDVTVGLADDTPLLRAARDAAYADAHARATQLAALAGRALGPAVEIDERVPEHGPRPPAARALAVDALAVAPSAVERSIALTVRWALDGTGR